ncbi:MAG TPA: carbon-nitrogen hydrolase family protein [Kofleriaceae bacterium]
MPSQTLRVAAVQVESHDGAVAANLARAETLVADAAAAGAQLVLCPEFLAAGYTYDESIWKSGEPRGGATEQWLVRLAAAHRIYLGATYLEADGDDFYNTFALAAPDGTIAGRVRKQSLPFFEGWFFKDCPLPKLIDTAIGRIAVGICMDTHTTRFMRGIADASPDLILLPHSAPCTPMARSLLRDLVSGAAELYARGFGVPVVLVNKARTRTRTPLPGLPFIRMPMAFPGLSTITDGDGRVVTQLRSAEGVAIGDVVLDPARKRRPDVPRGFWSRRPRRISRIAAAFFMLMERRGKRAYAQNPARPVAARAAVGASTVVTPGAARLHGERVQSG